MFFTIAGVVVLLLLAGFTYDRVQRRRSARFAPAADPGTQGGTAGGPADTIRRAQQWG